MPTTVCNHLKLVKEKKLIADQRELNPLILLRKEDLNPIYKSIYVLKVLYYLLECRDYILKNLIFSMIYTNMKYVAYNFFLHIYNKKHVLLNNA